TDCSLNSWLYCARGNSISILHFMFSFYETSDSMKISIPQNIRYDRADGIDMAFRPFDGRKDQFLFSLDATIPF
ncbi:hypothetical protein, partial [Nitrosomonas sp.]|uniref:hypothetical protein n=1 Tax=Nitrosomonas sp. TaxID=42353 RepID=UPI0025E46870